MASRKENLKSLFSNTRTRVIILFTLIVLILAVVVGYVKLRSATQGSLASADVTAAPGGIRSIPGVLEPTAQYAKLQEQQNVSQAIKAEQTGGSAIPTIIRTQALGQGVGVVGSKNGESGVGFSGLSRENEGGVQRSLWIQTLQNASCSKTSVNQVVSQGAQLSDLKQGCTCIQLRDAGYTLTDLEKVCSCPELKALGYSARDFKNAGYTALRLHECGFNACEERGAGFTALQMKDGGYSDGELKGAGFSDNDIQHASGIPDGMTAASIRDAGCGVAALTKLRQQGVSASAIRRISGCSAEQLKAAGYTAKELKDAGFTAAELKKAGFDAKALHDAGFTPAQLRAAGFTDDDLKNAGINPAGLTNSGPKGDCSVASLTKARAEGVSATTIRQTLGCSAKAMKDAGYTAKELKDAGFTAAELKNAGFNAGDLKNAGFSAKELADAGFTPQQLKDAGFTAKQLKDAGFTAAQLRAAGFSPRQLKDAGFSAADLRDAGLTAQQLKDAGFSADDLKKAGFSAAQLKAAGFNAKQLKDAGFDADDLLKAGFTPQELQAAGFSPAESQAGNAQLNSNLGGIPSIPNGALGSSQAQDNASNAQKLQAILDRQNQQMAEQKYQQKIQQRTSEMLSAANQSIQDWKKVNTQVYMAASEEKTAQNGSAGAASGSDSLTPEQGLAMGPNGKPRKAVIKTGDILFAVMDTSVNSDEPGPILATIVSGRLKGTKLIGSFNLPANADKMVITFNTMSVPGADKTQSISAYAVDPNTARTALSSRTNHHYMMRYGSLFASSFLQGFGNAIQSANTTVTIGGTGGGNNITVQQGIGQSTLENAVIGLATVGKAWGQQAQQIFNTPITVQVYAGTGLGILFTQDVTI